MYICHVTTEFSPFAKAGGLADVLEGLCFQQMRDGHTVEIILPKYDIIDMTIFDSVEIYSQHLWSHENEKKIHNVVYKVIYKGLVIFLIDPDHEHYYFSKGCIYGSAIDANRFVYFSRACVDFIQHEKKTPHILHLHDWPTAAILPIMHYLTPTFFHQTCSVYTIHNLAHQGIMNPSILTHTGINIKKFFTPHCMQDTITTSLINLKKGAINLSDAITTVSESYAEEILTPKMGYQLAKDLNKNIDKISGILNGIDLQTWDPSTDPLIFENYPSNSTHLEKVKKAKNINKQKVLEKTSLDPNAEGPLVITIARLAEQKGPEYIIEAIKVTLEKKGQFILLGSFCDSEIEHTFNQIVEKYKGNKHVFFSFNFDNDFSHQLYSAADIIFIPSKFEPCGLVQLIAMTYGTIPIAAETGGLKDTVIDASCEKGNGFLFQTNALTNVEEVLETAFYTYHCKKGLWDTLICNGLNEQFGWKKPASKYQALYLNALEKKKIDINQTSM